VPVDRDEDLLDVQTECAGIPIVTATAERLSLRPRVPTLFRFPLALGRFEYVFACPCGFISREHDSAARAAKEFCTVCLDTKMSRIRRRHYLARLGVRPSEPALRSTESVVRHG
jgi:hypothetical protein